MRAVSIDELSAGLPRLRVYRSGGGFRVASETSWRPNCSSWFVACSSRTWCWGTPSRRYSPAIGWRVGDVTIAPLQSSLPNNNIDIMSQHNSVLITTINKNVGKLFFLTTNSVLRKVNSAFCGCTFWPTQKRVLRLLGCLWHKTLCCPPQKK